MANQACISIGIDRYQFLPSLSYGVADAVAIEQFFVDAAGWSPHQCLLLTDTSPEKGKKSTHPTREQIDRWIKQWSWDTLHHGDLLWFFFSGCGVSFGDEDYLIPIDGNTQDLADTCISIRQLYRQFQEIGVNAMVFLDANHAQHLSLGGGIGNNTARFAQEYQIPTFLSCQSHEFSHEDAGLGHGLFTTALLEALNYHPDLNLETIETYLTSRMAELSEHHWKPLQTPMAIVPAGVSSYRPVFSATTQSSISATIPVEVIYTPPVPPKFNQDDNYQPYTPPAAIVNQVTLVRPEMMGTGAIVKKTRPVRRRKKAAHWLQVGFLLTLIFVAGGGIFALSSKRSTNEPSIARSGGSNDGADSVASGTSGIAAQLEQAKLFVKPGDATSRYQAILAARKIVPTTPAATTEIQQSIEQWSQEIYQISQGYASQQHWRLAIDTARMVPKDTTIYQAVQATMSEWQGKL